MLDLTDFQMTENTLSNLQSFRPTGPVGDSDFNQGLLLLFITLVILVASSFTAQFGVFAAERLQPRATGLSPVKWGVVEWFFLSYILGAIFVAGQVWEYATLISEGVALNSNAYGSAFYITTGFHALHVTGGLVAFLFVIGRTFAAKKYGHYEATSAIVVSYYWHFVDVVWIGLFLIVYVLK
jgi:cytochrome c oxidase subunit 3